MKSLLAVGHCSGGGPIVLTVANAPRVIDTVNIAGTIISRMARGPAHFVTVDGQRVTCDCEERAIGVFNALVLAEAEDADVVVGGSREMIDDSEVPF